MTALDPLDLDLLYFLCSASHHRCRVMRVRGPRLASLRRLRDAGFVGPDSFEPFAAVVADWLALRSVLARPAIETPVPSDSKAPAEPPAPKAVAKGGGRARSAGAPSPEPKASKVDIKVNTRRDPTQPPPGYQSRPGAVDLTEATIRTAQARGSPKRKQILEEAAARNAAGKSNGEKSVSVHVRMAQQALAEQDAEETRRNDPLEQAKTMIRRKTRHVVFGAEVSMGEKGKGKFFIGNKLVSRAELLAMAARLAA